MEAVAWTAIGLLGATILGSFFYLGNRFDNLAARIDTQGSDLGARIEAQGADLGSRIDALSARVDALSGRMDQHLQRHAG